MVWMSRIQFLAGIFIFIATAPRLLLVYLSSSLMGAWGSLPMGIVVKSAKLTTHPHLAKISECMELHTYFSYGPGIVIMHRGIFVFSYELQILCASL
jgi:hypothetical protein